jgi:hypothetical protein
MTAAVEAQPAVSVTDPQHVHTRTCYWDCREARWQCSTPASTVPARTDPPGR